MSQELNREQRRQHNRNVDKQIKELDKKKQAIIKRDTERLTRLKIIEQWLQAQPEPMMRFAVSRDKLPMHFIKGDSELKNADHKTFEHFRTTMFIKELIMLRIRTGVSCIKKI